MLAETSGRLSVRCREKRHPEIDGVGIAPQEHAALRREQEIVKRATAHRLEQVHVSTDDFTADQEIRSGLFSRVSCRLTPDD